jgi:D-glycero-alpha-D-manno-heptose 1-phosphate guanylyltransferase
MQEPIIQKGPIGNNTNPLECIVLAGGLGTRLKEAVPELPKCLAPVAGLPFLQHVIVQMQKQGVEHFIFSLGYKHEFITDFLSSTFPNLHYSLSIEDQPLGTGGAILKAMELCKQENIIVINGDTFFNISLDPVMSFHTQNQSACTLVLKPMKNFDRYGVVELNNAHQIVAFQEKKYYDFGLINGGTYVINKDKFLQKNLPEKFSFEKDYLEKEIGNEKIMGFVQDVYFIDIGIPEDFNRANVELTNLHTQ